MRLSKIDTLHLQRMIDAMADNGFWFDDINSHDGYYRFIGDYGTVYTFTSRDEWKEWFEEVNPFF